MGLEFNFESLEQKLSELEKKVAKGVTDKALKEVLLREQMQQVPEDTGDLKESLIVGKISGTGAKRKVLVGIDPKKADEVKYGYYQEHGTKVMLGKKWMKKSWIDSVSRANEAIKESIVEDLGEL